MASAIPFVCSTAHPEYLNLEVSLSKYDKGKCVNMYAPTDTSHTQSTLYSQHAKYSLGRYIPCSILCIYKLLTDYVGH